VLDGTAGYVIDGRTAHLVVTAAVTDDGIQLFLVPGDADGLERTDVEVLDLTRPMATLTYTGVRVDDEAQLTGGDPIIALHEALTAGVVALACEQVGGTQAVLASTTAYARDRVQFGRAIGSFQAVKHRLAEMLVQVESARSAAAHAARVVATDDLQERAIAAPLAAAYCAEVYEQRGRRLDPAVRRDRLHLGARRAPVLQAGEGDEAAARRPEAPPVAARPDPRGVTRARGDRASTAPTTGSPPPPGLPVRRPPAPATVRGRRRREAVLDAAEELFLARGFLGTSMDELGAAAGITGPWALPARRVQGRAAHGGPRSHLGRPEAGHRHGATILPPDAALDVLLTAHLDLAVGQPGALVLLIQELRHLPDDYRAQADRNHRRYVDTWVDALARTRARRTR
jgi:hypothetical protein